ncbi:5-oxoprolinase subunit PxpA [Halieaceae bacterium IMCC14734]|uniref:5-oxoprolinase subunit PxpA n=1 Tax=Candidatus Litorirhabdus singularis TaxID=2518993 RepID=A0ABT3TFI1_9GAMM|nr:5-oxoprolinase subunit PxpA [Candidatus Litorirhabdus singularis]MCX2981070.1 5-oxoprolinase subunit PxpA [Candidatus Litorirhabdus singularis]
MQLNCDLGESFGSWDMGLDEQVMPHIHQANIATGFHAGDPVTIHRTLQLAARHNVTVGAHPAYPDLVGFGRRSMRCSHEEIVASVLYQIAALDGMAASCGVKMRYVKPHGALYNDMMAMGTVRAAIFEAIASYHRPLIYMLQATPEQDLHRAEAAAANVEVWFEAFADRCYDDQGALLARSQPGAVHNQERMLAQVRQICSSATVTTVSGATLPMVADTLCVHGDNPAGVQAIREIRALVDAQRQV